MCSLVIDRDRLLASLYRFRCCHLQTPYVYVLYEHIGFVPCENHKCIYDVPEMESIALYSMHPDFGSIRYLHLPADQYLASDV